MQGESEPDEDIPEDNVSDVEEAASPVRTSRGRLAARKARSNIKAAFVPERRPLNLKVPG